MNLPDLAHAEFEDGRWSVWFQCPIHFDDCQMLMAVAPSGAVSAPVELRS